MLVRKMSRRSSGGRRIIGNVVSGMVSAQSMMAVGVRLRSEQMIVLVRG